MAHSQERNDNINRVIKAAQELFIEDGVAITSINKVAAKAGLAPMSIYRYFGGKDNLVVAVWRDALKIFYDAFMMRYSEKINDTATGFERYVACMSVYTESYAAIPKWYSYTREMLNYGMTSGNDTQLNMDKIFWQFYDREIPIPAIKALRDGIADGSVRPDIDINTIFQIMVNTYTGTNVYKGTKIDADPIDTLRLSAEIIAKYIKNDKDK